MKRILTYGTFDLFHIGHLNILKRLRSMGDELYVGVSTDEFNAGKNKRTFISFENRIEIVRSLSCVTHAFAEENWAQKEEDIEKYGIAVFGMGSDWEGKFDHLRSKCEVVYLDRTEGVSSTELKKAIASFNEEKIDDLLTALDYVKELVATMK